MKETNNEMVITGKKTVRALVLSTLGLISSILLSVAVLAISVKLFGVENLDPVIAGERIGLGVWLIGIVCAIVRTVRKK